MKEYNEDLFADAIEQNITADISNGFADMIIGKRIPTHLERVDFLNQYLIKVLTITPNDSPHRSKFSMLLQKLALVKEIMQTHISHRESE